MCFINTFNIEVYDIDNTKIIPCFNQSQFYFQENIPSANTLMPFH
jgi:hypothetical protein